MTTTGLLAGARREVVTKCDGCPFVAWTDDGYLCVREQRRIGRRVYAAETRPGWCPLPVIVIGG